ncbi:hypothetical protein ACH5RR_018447 [Cinchona calisaya]|uniref:Replication factor A C-terminal domain-containing protein n=1 Tax=Cinchona calisaya TaxID=153742 RepID=A0ABD2ZMR5_9GENT
MKTYMDSDKLLPPLVQEDIISIEKALIIFEKESAVWVRAKTNFVPNQQRLWYTVCKNCHKAVNVDIDWDITCPSSKEDSKVEVRFRLGIMLDDGTSKLHAVIFSLDAEKLIPFTAL